MIKIPDSISALSKEYGIKWTIWMWMSAFVGACVLTSQAYGWLAFVACVCLAIVGCMPLIPGKHNTIHNIIGVLSCVLSQTWVAIAGIWWILLIWWILYLLLLPIVKSKWCFFAEIWCITSILIKTITNFVF